MKKRRSYADLHPAKRRGREYDQVLQIGAFLPCLFLCTHLSISLRSMFYAILVNTAPSIQIRSSINEQAGIGSSNHSP